MKYAAKVLEEKRDSLLLSLRHQDRLSNEYRAKINNFKEEIKGYEEIIAKILEEKVCIQGNLDQVNKALVFCTGEVDNTEQVEEEEEELTSRWAQVCQEVS